MIFNHFLLSDFICFFLNVGVEVLKHQKTLLGEKDEMGSSHTICIIKDNLWFY